MRYIPCGEKKNAGRSVFTVMEWSPRCIVKLKQQQQQQKAAVQCFLQKELLGKRKKKYSHTRKHGLIKMIIYREGEVGQIELSDKDAREICYTF